MAYYYYTKRCIILVLYYTLWNVHPSCLDSAANLSTIWDGLGWPSWATIITILQVHVIESEVLYSSGELREHGTALIVYTEHNVMAIYVCKIKSWLWIYVCFSCNIQTKWWGNVVPKPLPSFPSLAVQLHNGKLGEGLGTKLMFDQITEVIEEAGRKVVISKEC